MVCNSCGSNVPDGSAVCPNCGAPVAAGTQVPFGMNGGASNASFFQREAASINIIALIVAAVGLVCTLFAKVTVSAFGMSVSEGIMSHYGGIMVALFVFTGIMLFVKKDNVALVPAAINAAFCLFKVFQELGTDVSEYGGLMKVGLNPFFWLMTVAAIAVVAAILLVPKMLGNKN